MAEKKKLFAKKEAPKVETPKEPELADATKIVDTLDEVLGKMNGSVGKYLPSLRALMGEYKVVKTQLREELGRAVARKRLK